MNKKTNIFSLGHCSKWFFTWHFRKKVICYYYYYVALILTLSGCGKTTLLSVISGRGRRETGTLKINDSIVTNDSIRNISGYLYQEDIFIDCLTVSEHLRFIVIRIEIKLH